MSAQDQVQGDMEEMKERNALDVFPAELWFLIFENLTDPVGLRSCVEVFKELEDILNTRRCHYLLPEVLSLVISNAYPHLTKQDLLSMRHTCKDWKTSIDMCMEYNSHSSVLPFQENKDLSIPTHLRNNLLNNYRFYQASDFVTAPSWEIDKFIRFMEHYPPIPSVPFKFVEFHGDEYYFTNGAVRLLEIYGGEVKHLSICSFLLDEFLPWLSRLLSHTPNLKTLHLNRIRNKLLYNEEFSRRRGGRLPSVTPPRPPPQFVAQPPPENAGIILPVLPQLTTLSFSSTNEEVVTIVMKNYGNQAQNVKLWDSTMWPPHCRRDLGVPNMTQMTDLSLSAEDYLLINSPLVSTWPVTRLQITDSRWSPEKFDIFAVLNHFGSTLKLLDLSPWNEYEGLVCHLEQTPPHMPHLETLIFKVQAKTDGVEAVPGLTFNFIRHLPSLKYVHVKVVREMEWKQARRGPTVIPPEERVQVIGYTDQMYHSNIWDLLPSLESVTVKKEFYIEAASGTLQSQPGKWARKTNRFTRAMLMNMRI